VAFARPFLGLRENDLCIGKIALFPSRLVRDWPTVTISLSMPLAIENIVLGIQILYSLSEEKREVRQQAHHHDIID